jgi:hypothetical protein
MRHYARVDEERILLQGRVRDWTGAGLLSAEQASQLESDLRVPLRRTGRMLRIGLAVFTVVAIAATLGFIVLLADLDSESAVGIVLLLGGIGCFGGADHLVVRYRLYRHGVEEALAGSAVFLVSLGIGMLIPNASFPSIPGIVSALLAGAVGGFQVYRRLGLRYAAVAAMGCAAFIPIQLALPTPVGVLLASAVLAGIFGVARHVRRAHQNDLTGEEMRTFEVAAVAGTYLVLNLHVGVPLLGIGGDAVLVPWFKWTTYVLVWALPPITMWLGVRERERALLDIGIVTLLVTLVTNKQYLGIARNPWDPIVFGVLVAGAAIFIRRWIAAGPREERGGFTSARVSAEEAEVIAAIGTASAAFHPAPRDQPDIEQHPGFGGGRSGGAGGGAGF